MGPRDIRMIMESQFTRSSMLLTAVGLVVRGIAAYYFGMLCFLLGVDLGRDFRCIDQWQEYWDLRRVSLSFFVLFNILFGILWRFRFLLIWRNWISWITLAVCLYGFLHYFTIEYVVRAQTRAIQAYTEGYIPCTIWDGGARPPNDFASERFKAGNHDSDESEDFYFNQLVGNTIFILSTIFYVIVFSFLRQTPSNRDSNDDRRANS
jgi:hypothetical protein